MQSERIIQHDSIQIMLDEETMGLRTQTAPIISIGAVKFTLNDGIIDRFKINISLSDLVQNYGKITEAGTVAWWKQQGDDVLKRSLTNAVPALEATQQFTAFCKDADFVWANGIDFDFPKLIELYISVYGEDSSAPWKYWTQCDYRTILTVFGYDNRKVRAYQAEQNGAVYHDALSDSEGQAEFLINILRAIYE